VQIQFDARVAANAACIPLALFLLGCNPAAEVPVWGTVPDFSLVNQSTEPYGTAQLKGRPWIADFIFTKCPSRCPMLTREMSRLQTELHGRGWDDVMLVSISVDPANDTPEALIAYAAKHSAKLGSWQFLTGTRDDIWSLSVNGFKLPVQEIEDASASAGPILHSNRFVLADGQQQIRGYYDAFDADDRAKLLRDLEIVRAETAAVTSSAPARGARPRSAPDIRIGTPGLVGFDSGASTLPSSSVSSTRRTYRGRPLRGT
jgi:protein SCO1/2